MVRRAPGVWPARVEGSASLGLEAGGEEGERGRGLGGGRYACVGNRSVCLSGDSDGGGYMNVKSLSIINHTSALSRRARTQLLDA